MNEKDIPRKCSSSLSRRDENAFIIEKVQELLTRHDRIILFATNVGHAKEISAMLEMKNIFPITLPVPPSITRGS